MTCHKAKIIFFWKKGNFSTSLQRYQDKIKVKYDIMTLLYSFSAEQRKTTHNLETRSYLLTYILSKDIYIFIAYVLYTSIFFYHRFLSRFVNTTGHTQCVCAVHRKVVFLRFKKAIGTTKVVDIWGSHSSTKKIYKLYMSGSSSLQTPSISFNIPRAPS